jgi:hypothetical protein
MSLGVARAWALTVAVETPIVALVFRRQWRRMALACALATSATNLAMNLWLSRAGAGYLRALVAWELVALLAEAAVYALASRPRDVARALVASGLANAASFEVAAMLLR